MGSPSELQATNNGLANESHGSHESDEGHAQRRSDDCCRCIQLRRRKGWLEAEEREGCRRRLHVGGGSSSEEEWSVQGRWHAQFEVEGEACTCGPQGCEPIHQGALRVQSEACLENREGLRHEEAEGRNQLRSGLVRSAGTV